jgi:hypothetical protein
VSPEFGTPIIATSLDQVASTVHPVIVLGAPTTVPPAPSAEQKQNHKNNQYGFHVAPHWEEEAGLAFVTVASDLPHPTS